MQKVCAFCHGQTHLNMNMCKQANTVSPDTSVLLCTNFYTIKKTKNFTGKLQMCWKGLKNWTTSLARMYSVETRGDGTIRIFFFFFCLYWEWNSGPNACQAGARSLSYITSPKSPAQTSAKCLNSLSICQFR